MPPASTAICAWGGDAAESPLHLQGDSRGLASRSCGSGSAQLMGAHERSGPVGSVDPGCLAEGAGEFLGWLGAPGSCRGLLGSSAAAAQHPSCSSLWYWPLPCSRC